MTAKYLKVNTTGGGHEEEIPIVSTTGVSDAGKIVQTDSGGLLDPSLFPAGVLAQSKVLPASEDLAAGDFVNVWDDTGTPKVRLATASTSGKEAHGFVLASVSSGGNATVYFEGQNTQVTGATAGNVFLSAATPGGFTSTPPSGTGKIVQRIGTAVAATSIDFEQGLVIKLA
jgi:hypothetical protein